MLVRWYELTGDEKYIRLGKTACAFILAGARSSTASTRAFRHVVPPP